jgi:hypothetical protein
MQHRRQRGLFFPCTMFTFQADMLMHLEELGGSLSNPHPGLQLMAVAAVLYP